MKRRVINLFSLFAILAMVVSCGNVKQSNNSIINTDDLKQRISVLASDDFQGRFPGTIGEEKTIKYLEEQFKLVGAQPGNGQSYFQEVPLIQITSDQIMKLKIKGAKEELLLNFSEDFIGGTPQPIENIDITNSELVFVGFGINAPDYGWNDYAGVDVKGKMVIALVNDPGFYDSSLFKGKNMTYYGRWIYKYEEAARQGAAGVILVHETEAASYPWGVVQNSWSGTRFYLADNIVTKSGLKFQSWVTKESANRIFDLAGVNYEKALQDAAKKGFAAQQLNLNASIGFKNSVKYINSKNVVALIPGTDLSDEYIIYTAHWDHFGVNPKFKGDSILNGALDNATGTAALVEMARVFNSQEIKPKRSILLMAVTCEEQGLLGSQFYAENPIYPLNKTVAVINMDALNIFGKTKDMSISGLGYSELDDYAVEVLKAHNRYAAADPKPERGGYYRSDHFSFAKVGVPSINMGFGVDNIEHGKQWSMDTMGKWISENYHKPTDNYEPNIWKFDGMVEDLTVYFELGYKLSMIGEFPNWRDGVFYKAKRDEMMNK
ncbi:MAG: M28 family peptidase [Bacteroidales bacterium]|nr:MAG: M28 family peptidase [Bacteroidales bacterium]